MQLKIPLGKRGLHCIIFSNILITFVLEKKIITFIISKFALGCGWMRYICLPMIIWLSLGARNVLVKCLTAISAPGLH